MDIETEHSTGSPLPQNRSGFGLFLRVLFCIACIVLIATMLYTCYVLQERNKVNTQYIRQAHTTISSLENRLTALQGQLAELQKDQNSTRLKIENHDLIEQTPSEIASSEVDTAISEEVPDDPVLLEESTALTNNKSLSQLPVTSTEATNAKDASLTTSLHLNQMLLAALDLNESIIQQKPYTKELFFFAELASNQHAVTSLIESLKPNASSGIVSYAILKERFTPLAQQVLRYHVNQLEKASVYGKIRAFLSEFITVQKVGEHVQGTDIPSLLAQAEQHMANEHFDLAVETLSQLPPGATSLMQNWMDDATSSYKAHTYMVSILEYIKELVYEQMNQPQALPQS